jgi:hypothetical protein
LTGDDIVGQLGIDNIAALEIPEPGSLLLLLTKHPAAVG